MSTRRAIPCKWQRYSATDPGGQGRLGGTPHGHIQLPADGPVRPGATVFVRTARPRWLTSSWLAAVAIGYITVISRLKTPVLFSASPGRAGTAAGLLPVLLGVFTILPIRRPPARNRQPR